MEDIDVHNDGPLLHEAALKMGVNIVAWFFDPQPGVLGNSGQRALVPKNEGVKGLKKD
jgi:hypothetical protein